MQCASVDHPGGSSCRHCRKDSRVMSQAFKLILSLILLSLSTLSPKYLLSQPLSSNHPSPSQHPLHSRGRFCIRGSVRCGKSRSFRQSPTNLRRLRGGEGFGIGVGIDNSGAAFGMEKLVEILNNCMNPDLGIRTKSESELSVLADKNYGMFAHNLVLIMLSPTAPITVKQQAGLYLKNTVSAKEIPRLEQLQERWLSVPPSQRQEVKDGLLRVLEDKDLPVQKVAAQVIAKIFGAEIKVGGWPEIVSRLSTLVSTHQSTRIPVTTTALTALGYVCEEMNEDEAPQDDINQALTAIIANMNHNSADITLAAVNALRNAIHLTARNFEVEAERDMIMKMLCEAASSQEPRVRVVGFESLALIAEKFYGKLGPYMEAIYSLTVSALTKDIDQVQVVAIEFWSTLAEVEDDIIFENQHIHLGLTSGPRTEPCMHYIRAVAPHLVGTLFGCLMRQDDIDEDSWNAAKAGATCLELMARVVGDPMIDYMMPTVENHIQQSSWRSREAAAMALGSILDGPSKEKLGVSISSRVVDIMIPLVTDTNELVRDTAAWLLSRLAQHVPHVYQGDAQNAAIQGVVRCLDDTPKVATKGLSAVWHLAHHSVKDYTNSEGPLNAYLGELIRKLHAVAERSTSTPSHSQRQGRDGSEANMASIAYETIMELVKAARPSQQAIVEETLQHSINRVKQTLAEANGGDEGKELRFLLQSQLTGVIEACLSVASGDLSVRVSSDVMQILLSILHSSNTAAHQDCLRTAGLLAQELGQSFSEYMGVLWPYLAISLSDTASASNYITAVLATSDMTRALEGNILPYCDQILTSLLNGLSSPTVESRAKPPTLSAIGDIALAISGNFVRYAPAVMSVLQQATEFDMPIGDVECAKLRNELWEGILTAYSGVIMGLRDASPAEFSDSIKVHTGTMVGFIRKVSDGFASVSGTKGIEPLEGVVRAALALVGDIAGGCGPEIAVGLQLPFVQNLIEGASACPEYSQKTRDTASFARQAVYGVPLQI
ncbi:hypothetical protein AAMO2058_001065600 [Amorphochlora amoebiformis]